MLTLERWRRRSIYSLGGRRGTRASALYCAQTDGAGCPGDGPDVRGFTESRMSGLAGWMSGLEELTLLLSVWRVADFQGRGRMSGVDVGCLGPVALGGWAAVAVVVVSSGRMSGPGAGCPGPGAAFFFFRRSSSSVNLAACLSSRASSGGSS